MRDRETALQADVAKQKELADTLRRSQQLAFRARDDALKKHRETAAQLQHAQEDLAAAQYQNAAMRRQLAEEGCAAADARASDAAGGEGHGMSTPANGPPSALSAAHEQSHIRVVGGHKKGWRVLEAERGRRNAELHAEKTAKELDEQRARCEVLARTIEAVQRDSSRMHRCNTALQHLVKDLQLRLLVQILESQLSVNPTGYIDNADFRESRITTLENFMLRV